MIRIGDDRPPRIMIIDDEPHDRRLLEVMLASEGFEIHLATSGEEALEMIRHDAPDLILLDIVMTGMDGCATTAVIKSNPATKNIPVIMVTAMDDRNARMLGLGAGAEDFLTKPVDRAELCVRVRNLLRLKAYGEHYDNYSKILESEVVARTSDLIERTRTLEEHSVALQLSEERTNYALAGARIGLWDVDMSTHQLTWSESMAPLFAMTPAQKPTGAAEFFALIHPEDRRIVEQAISGIAQGGIAPEIEFRITWPDGTHHWIAGRANMLCNSAGVPTRLLGVATDIGDRKALEAQFRQAQKMEAVGQLAGGVAHDFNNLLTAILGFSSFVADTFEGDDPRRADMQEVIKAAARATKLTTQLLAFSRQQILQPTTVDLNALVSGIRPMLGRLVGEHLDVAEILADDLGLVRADAGQLEQVLVNLVINARDAMPSGGRLAIETMNADLDDTFMQGAAIQPGPYVMVSVTDTGTGMTEETRQRLFEPFFTTKEQGRGTGLGLSTVYGIVKQSGGYISVYSEIGKGATFRVYLPRVDADEQITPVAAPERGSSSGTENVLLVEDDAAVRFLSRRILEKSGYMVHEAGNPTEAEALFERMAGEFDLLLTDIVMPGSNGFQLYQRLALRAPELKVLYMSGYTRDAIVSHGRIDPGIEFLQKPFTFSALSQRVREVLDR